MRTDWRNVTPALAASSASRCVNLKQSPVSSPGSSRPPTNFSRTVASAGSCSMQPARVEQPEADAAALQDRDVGRTRVELLAGAKELQRAARAFVVGDAGAGPQRPQAIAAVLGQPHHAGLVDLVARGRAVAQHRQAPADHVDVEVGADDERPMPHQQPLDGLQRHAGPGPRRRIAGRHLAGIGEAGFQRRRRLAVDDDDLVAGERELVGRRHADHPAAQHQHLHREPFSTEHGGTRRAAPHPAAGSVGDDGANRCAAVRGSCAATPRNQPVIARARQ